MSKYAHIPLIRSGIAFSDPLYGEDVWCQYRKAFQDANWYMKLDASKAEYDCVDLMITLGRPTLAGRLQIEKDEEGFSYRHPAHYTVQQLQLGIDSARIFFGSLEEFQNWGEDAAFHTGGDGLCGDLLVFTGKGDDEPAGFLLSCSFEEEFVTEKDVFRQLLSSLEGKEISREQFLSGVDPKKLGNRILMTTELKIAEQAAQKGSIAPEKGQESQR